MHVPPERVLRAECHAGAGDLRANPAQGGGQRGPQPDGAPFVRRKWGPADTACGPETSAARPLLSPAGPQKVLRSLSFQLGAGGGGSSLSCCLCISRATLTRTCASRPRCRTVTNHAPSGVR